MTQRALTNEDALSILANYMQTQDFNNVKFIVSGFSNQWSRVSITAGNDGKGQLVVDLLLDRPYTADLPEVLTLFHETGKLYFRLFKVQENGKSLY